MPRVPVAEIQVRPQGYRASQDIRAPEGAFGGQVGQAFQRAGQQMQGVGEDLARHALRLQQEDDAAKALEAYTNATTAARSALWDTDKGIYTRRGAQAMGSAAEAGKQLDLLGRTWAEGLENESQRRAFNQFWLRHQSSELDSVSRHEARERQGYKDQVSAALVKGAADDAANRFNDPAAISLALDTADRAILANGTGLPPDAVDLQRANARSAIHKSVVLRRAVTDPLGAQAYYQEHADAFTAEDHVTLQRTLEPTIRRARAQQGADSIIQRVTRPAGSLEDAVEQVESGGRGDAVSSKGAQGVMQVMPATGEEVARKLGIAWEPERMTKTDPESVAYQRRLGREYLAQQLEAFGGNRTLALAAYNAGPARVAEWIQRFGDPRDGAISEAAWAARIPISETRAYIGKVNARLTQPSENLPLGEAMRLAGDEFADDPELREAVEARISRENGVREAVRRDREQQASDQAWQHLLGGGGYDSLPPEVLRDIPPTLHASLQNYEAKRAAGTRTVTDRDAYLELSNLAGADADGFLATNLNDYRDRLSDADWQHFADLRRSMQAAGEKAGEAKGGERTRVQIATDTLRSAGIDPTPKEGTTKAVQVKLFSESLDRAVRDHKASTGKTPNSDEIQRMADQLVIRGALKDTGLAGWFSTERRVFELTPEEVARFEVRDVEQIPRDHAAGLRAAFRRASGRDPTDAEVLTDYNEFLQTRLPR